jgi:hypothetical protein
MAKAVAPGVAAVPNVGTFQANVLPDPFDARDLEYRPRLQPLPPTLDARRRDDGSKPYVMRQAGNSCTGHAVAAMINTVLGQVRKDDPCERVSPYMLYHLARRYDEFPGEADAGSSLRGVLKGWWRHGVALQKEWPKLESFASVEDARLEISCRKRPLGAFYRVNAMRLDDMQSAISELHAIVASAVIHDGWLKPVVEPDPHGGKPLHVIRPGKGELLGGHAFVFAGYNEAGFLVQNSWGDDWGNGGFATLPYQDWLDSAYDAWVARPGVPHTPFDRLTPTVTADGVLTVSAAPNLATLRKHVVNLGNNGRLSTSGKMTSTPQQLREIFQSLTATGFNDVMIYAHGGLKSEGSGLDIAQRQHQWWLNNGVYPIFITWETGPLDVVADQFADKTKNLPFAAAKFVDEALDRGSELLARTAFAWAWREMKQNAVQSSEPLAALPAKDAEWFDKPGATLLALLLRKQRDANPNLRVHVVGHSAGAVLHGAFVPRLIDKGVKVESLAFLAPAITVADFTRQLLNKHLGTNIDRFAAFVLNDELELDDVCKAGPVTFYRKSLLYLVSRGFEQPANGEKPLLGMVRFLTKDLRDAIRAKNGSIIVSRTASPDVSRCNSTSHGGFDDDEPTMTSVLLRVLKRTSAAQVERYTPNAAPKTSAFAAGAARLTIKGQPNRRRKPRARARAEDAVE